MQIDDQTTLYKHNFTIKWRPFALLNGWSSYNAFAGATLWHEASYAVTPDGWLCFRGLLYAVGATNEVFGVLAADATPKRRAEFEWHGYNNVTAYNSPAGTVQESGRVYIQVIANQQWVSLENTRVWLGT